MTREMRQLKGLFRLWTWLFALGGLLFFLFPDRVIAFLNESSNVLPFLEPWPEVGASFWLPLAVSLMTTLTLFCIWVVREDPGQVQPFVIAILLSKATSSLVFFFFYVRQNFAAPFFWGALTDGLIFLVTFYFYKRAWNSAPQA